MDRFIAIGLSAVLAFSSKACISPSRILAADVVVPHGQDRNPGPPLSPEEAIKRMIVPDGFHVELVASEPDLVNPVAMTFDERGRIWVAESLEYPRWEPGRGRDRIKILEDTDADGRADRFTIFADGLNIPSGLAVGYGGVWVANAPELLLLKDTDGDGRADSREVVVTGFGRRDTHELPNSLTWGPDGWLYGLNGVFNPCRIDHQGQTHTFTCAVWRVHPRTREFELFAEGTSNPWGIAFDTYGSMFLSACVIDHLWHIVETGYYHRQAGAYPPHTWKIGSIVEHRHQKAAYCGIHYFDSDAYPPEYRERLYMGNIHGGCINVDVLDRRGSSYFARPAPDFLTANDAWFMPVAQKTGPDGCLYVLDWYDRYHCYQDARRDPQGIDRLKGRLYRVRYRNTPRVQPFDLAKLDDTQLVERLFDPNVYYRQTAQRLLSERGGQRIGRLLHELILDDTTPMKTRMHALWAVLGMGPLDAEWHRRLLARESASLRAWGVRAAGNQKTVTSTLRERIVQLAGDPSPDVQLQVAVAARKIVGVDPAVVLLDVLAQSGGDELVPHIVWQNLLPLFDAESGHVLEMLAEERFNRSPHVLRLLPRVVDRLLANEEASAAPAGRLLQLLVGSHRTDHAPAAGVMRALTNKLRNHELTDSQVRHLRTVVEPIVAQLLENGPDGPLHLEAVLLATGWHDPAAIEASHLLLVADDRPVAQRLQALESLAAAGDERIVDVVDGWFSAEYESPRLRRVGLAALSRLSTSRVADVVLTRFSSMSLEERALAVELLTQRPSWSKRLLVEIGQGELPKDVLNANHARTMLADDDAQLRELVEQNWGTVRERRDPQREVAIRQMRQQVQSISGDPNRGQLVFKKVCAQCHRLHEEGENVGPDLTRNARNSVDQLLSDIFDPNLVVGSAYRSRTVVTEDGRILSGIVVEDNPQRIVLKLQGGRVERIARSDVLASKQSRLSIMPEGIEKQLRPQEVADLLQFLLLDGPPDKTNEAAQQ